MKTKITCPLGSECESINGDHVETCAWYTTLTGLHPQTGESVDEKMCAITWLPLILTEVSGTNRGQTAALESMRNEQVKGHEEFMNVITHAATNKRLR